MNKLFGLLLLALVAVAPGAASAANCFWVGGSANLDGTNTGGGGTGGIKWASTSGGNSACAGGGTGGSPGPADNATFDALSGGGTATVTVSNPTFNSINTSTSVTGLSLGSNGLTVLTWTNTNGTSAINMGSGTIAITATSGNVFLFNNASNVTANSATITFAGGGANARTITFGTVSYGTVSFAANSSGGGWIVTGATTIGTLNIAAPNTFSMAASTTYTLTNGLAVSGSSGNVVSFLSGTFGTSFTLALGAASTCSWCSVRDMTNTTNSFTLTNSFDLGRNTFTGGGSISPPSGGGGGGGRIIGG